MAQREERYRDAINTVAAGSSVQVVGDRGSGRSRFLDRLQDDLLNRPWHVLRINGNASFRVQPFVALALAGVQAARDPRAASIHAAVAELLDRLPAGQSAIIVDDWEDIDEWTWGAICAVYRAHNIPVVIARLRGRPSRLSSGGFTASAVQPGLSVDLAPMSFDELHSSLRLRLQNDVDAPTISRIYAKSGGNIGLALAMVDAGVREGRLELVADLWVATRDLWSPSLAVYVESLLDTFPSEQLEVLEMLGILGTVDLATVHELADPVTVEELESASCVELFPAGNRVLVAVRPPMVVEYFRHIPQSARRLRLTQRIREKLHLADVPLEDVAVDEADDHSAQFVRLVREQLRTRRLLAFRSWIRCADKTSASDYADALSDCGASSDELEELFQLSGSITGTPEATLRWVMQYAEFRAVRCGDPRGAIGLLRDRAPELGSLGVIAEARAVEIEHAFLGGVDLDALPRPTVGQHDVPTRIAIHRAFAFVLCSRGRITDSQAHVRSIALLSGSVLDCETATISIVNHVALGDLEEARRIALRGLDEARGRLDAGAMRAYGAAACLVGALSGTYAEAEEILEVLGTLNQPFSRPPFAQLTLEILASVIAIRRGSRRAAGRHLANLEVSALPDGALPGASRAWASAQWAASRGDTNRAVQLLRDAAADSWERGARLSAAFSCLQALEVSPSPELLEQARGYIENIDGAYLAAQLNLHAGVIEGSVSLLEDAADALIAAGDIGLALIALDASSAILDADGAAQHAKATRSRAQSIRATTSAARYDTVRFGVANTALTDRELEVARLAASGLSNGQIAAELVLSVRTVESHVHRIMRKAGVDRRKMLAEFLAQYES